MGKGGQRPPAAKDGMVASEHAWKEITQHRTPDDAWLMINNKVYDVSGWHDHPGGDVLFTSAGDDATDTFALFHASSGRAGSVFEGRDAATPRARRRSSAGGSRRHRGRDVDSPRRRDAAAPQPPPK